MASVHLNFIAYQTYIWRLLNSKYMYNNAMHKVQYFSVVDYILTDSSPICLSI